jgi:hypothetical protein
VHAKGREVASFSCAGFSFKITAMKISGMAGGYIALKLLPLKAW